MGTVTFRGTWQALVRLLEPGGHRMPLFFGLFLLTAFAFMREPSLQELRPIGGTVSSVQARTDRHGRVSNYEFTLNGHSEVFWSYHRPTDALNPIVGAHVTFHSAFSGDSPRQTLAGTVKTYGLAVNGVIVGHYETDLDVAHFWLDTVFPVVGTIFLAIGLGIWTRRERRVTSPNTSLERTRDR